MPERECLTIMKLSHCNVQYFTVILTGTWNNPYKSHELVESNILNLINISGLHSKIMLKYTSFLCLQQGMRMLSMIQILSVLSMCMCALC